MRGVCQIAALAGVCSLAPMLRADFAYLLQARSISATTSADGNFQAVAAQDFSPFAQTLNLSTTFTAPAGDAASNAAGVGIDCQLNPNAIRVSGTLSGSGGLSVVGGEQVLQFGEGQATINTTFQVSQSTSFRMTASPRPSAHPGDRFKIRLKDESTHTVLFLLDDSMPPEAVDLSGTLDPATLSLEYQVELTVDGPETLRDFSFSIQLGEHQACYANCDGSTGSPLLNIQDFSCFLQRFASGDAYANCDGSIQPPVLNVADFSCFLTKFATGCP